jgi:hypothetical protein
MTDMVGCVRSSFPVDSLSLELRSAMRYCSITRVATGVKLARSSIIFNKYVIIEFYLLKNCVFVVFYVYLNIYIYIYL